MVWFHLRRRSPSGMAGEVEDFRARLAPQLPLLEGLEAAEWERLYRLVGQFTTSKRWDPVQGLRLTEAMQEIIAVQAVLPVLGSDLRLLDNWQTLIIYPETFVPFDPSVDEMGVVHDPVPHTGQSWPNGPVVLSWGEIAMELAGETDYPQNVVIHEVVHQMDYRSGDCDGMPPLPSHLDSREWIHEFTLAFKRFRRGVDRGREVGMDPYGAEGPPEFLAVAAETFFVAPEVLSGRFPSVYRLLKGYFRQDPLLRAKKSPP